MSQPSRPSRIPLPAIADMTEAQLAIYNQSVAFFGAPIGPRVVFLETPEVGLAWSALLAAIEKSSLPKRVWELAILIVAREWTSQFEWWAHEGPALKAGLPSATVEAIRAGRTPDFDAPLDEAAHRFVTELLRDRRVADGTYQALLDLVGSRQMIELTALVGHYSNVAMTLIAHDVALPAHVTPPLPILDQSRNP